MSAYDDAIRALGRPGAIAPAPVNSPCDQFENAIRAIGIIAACEWFGHEWNSEFTTDTIKHLARHVVENDQGVAP